MKFGEFLKIEKGTLIPISDTTQYVIAGVQNYGKGIVNRRRVSGAELTMKRYQVIKENQLMWCKVDTKNGAFGITRKEHIGSLASTNMCLANINTEKVLPDFLQLLFTLNWFYDFITEKSTGTTNRQYLTPQQILEEIAIPDFTTAEQKQFINKYDAFYNSGLLNELVNQQSYLQLLRESILQEAIQGKLVPQDVSDEPADQLLQRIKAEKIRLVKEGKLKKEKELPPITEEEKPFELPKGWVWCRLGEICTKIGSGSTPRGGKNVYKPEGIKFIRSQNVYNEGLQFDSIAYIDETTHQKMSGTKVLSQDILLNITGGSIGRCALVPSDFQEANVSQHVTIVRIVSLLNYEFIHNLMLSPYFQDYIKATQTGGNREGLAKKNMQLMLIPLPSLPEQQRIMAKVQQLMQTVLTLEQQVHQNKDQSQQLLQAILHEAFSGEQKEYAENEMLTMAAEE